MSNHVATILAPLLLMLAVAAAPADRTPKDRAMAQAQTAPPAHSAAAEREATERARNLLAERLQVRPETISVSSAEPATWNNTGLGCAAPGTVTMQQITEGYVVLLSAQGRTHRVHVAGKLALVCDRPMLTRDELRKPRYARGLDVAIEKARADLAQHLGIDVEQIRLAGMQPMTWEDDTLGCPAAERTPETKSVQGYRLALQAGSRTYTYHTDLEEVRACPPIEAQ